MIKDAFEERGGGGGGNSLLRGGREGGREEGRRKMTDANVAFPLYPKRFLKVISRLPQGKK